MLTYLYPGYSITERFSEKIDKSKFGYDHSVRAIEIEGWQTVVQQNSVETL